MLNNLSFSTMGEIIRCRAIASSNSENPDQTVIPLPRKRFPGSRQKNTVGPPRYRQRPTSKSASAVLSQHFFSTQRAMPRVAPVVLQVCPIVFPLVSQVEDS